METLSPHAAAMLDRMEPDRGYEALDLRRFVPEITPDRLREIMHELWVSRHVERFGYSGWRRHRSTCGTQETSDPPRGAARRGAHRIPPPETKGVRPEDLFDHEAFGGMFK